MSTVAWRRRWIMLALLTLAGELPAQAARSDNWVRAATPELEVITKIPTKDAAAWASEFAQYVAALRQLFNHTKAKLPPLTVVVFARERDFERYHPLIGPGGKAQRVDGYFSRQESWAVVGMIARPSEDARRTIFHEGVHWFLSGGEVRNAVWLEEGLAEVFSTFRAEKDRAEWGRAIGEHVALLEPRFRLPLEKLLYTAQGDLFGKDEVRTGIVYAQSWAFVHFVIFGKHDLPRAAIGDYTAELTKGKHPDEAFRTAFKHTYAEMDKLLDRYLNGGSYYVARQPLVAITPPTVQPATPLEVENALGRLALAGHRTKEAIAHARAAILAVDADPRGHELLGVALQAAEDIPGARAAYAAAAERDSRDFRPHFELAVAAHNAAVESGGELTPDEARAIANRYERAINLYPRFRMSYENLAGLVGAPGTWGAEDRKFLEQGRRLFPESGMIQVGLAVLTRRAGDSAGAREQLDRILAARSGLSADGLAFASKLDLVWESEDIGKGVDELVRAGKFRDALAFLDERLARGVDVMLALRLKPVREQLEVGEFSRVANEALREQKWTEARRALGKLVASPAAPGMVKDQARRTLADLDRQKLGLDANQP